MATTNIIAADLDDPNQIAGFTSWDLDFRQIEAGPGRTRVVVRAGRTLSALSIGMQSRVHQVGAAPSGLITFGIPKAGSLRNWKRSDVPGQAIVCFDAGAEFEGVSEAGFEAVTLSVCASELKALAADVGIDAPARKTNAGILDLSSRPGLAEFLFRRSMDFIRPQGTTDGGTAEDDLILRLLLAVCGGRVGRSAGPPRARERALHRALEIIEARSDDPPSIRRLCIQCETSLPTLHRAFTERFGIGPKAYLTRLRLNRVRAELLTAGPDGKVADIANRWGFWHMGQFARDYRRLFSRLPSEDLFG